MVDISRRFFLGGAIAATAAITIPLIKTLPLRPLLYGDGIHDDTYGLQALFNGEHVDIVGDRLRLLRADAIELTGGTFNISEMLTIRRHRRVTVSNAIVQCTPRFKGECMLYVETDAEARIFNNYFKAAVPAFDRSVFIGKAYSSAT